MSKYYNSKRTRNLYNPKSSEPYKLSRSKIDLFLACPCCFYLDRKLGVGRPPGFPFNLNSAVDTLLKKEFDSYREKGSKHPLIKKYKIDARPIPHKMLNQWRHNFTGIQFLHQPTNLFVFGAIDDLWQNSKQEFIVVDYKATAKKEEITALNQDWQDSYKRQMEIYQWLLRNNDCLVSDTGYFVYCNGKADKASFNAKLEFDLTLIPYTGTDTWVEQTLFDIHKCLQKDVVPESAPDCDYCAYREAAGEVVK